MKVQTAIKLFVCALLVIVTSCARVEQAPVLSPVVPSAGIQENLGEEVARHLTNRYADTRGNCGADSKPAFLCSGIMIRGTSNNPSYHVWDNSPESIAKGGVSFSYLRSDADFRHVAVSYNNGFIFESYQHAADKIHPEVLCSFPRDAHTRSRNDAGCGAYPGYEASKACHLKGVTTAAQWWADYTSHAADRELQQCGFDVRDQRNAAAGPAFAASVAARGYFNATESYVQNELILGLGKRFGRKVTAGSIFLYP